MARWVAQSPGFQGCCGLMSGPPKQRVNCVKHWKVFIYSYFQLNIYSLFPTHTRFPLIKYKKNLLAFRFIHVVLIAHFIKSGLSFENNRSDRYKSFSNPWHVNYAPLQLNADNHVTTANCNWIMIINIIILWFASTISCFCLLIIRR